MSNSSSSSSFFSSFLGSSFFAGAAAVGADEVTLSSRLTGRCSGGSSSNRERGHLALAGSDVVGDRLAVESLNHLFQVFFICSNANVLEELGNLLFACALSVGGALTGLVVASEDQQHVGCKVLHRFYIR